jgi:hypothetical protein
VARILLVLLVALIFAGCASAGPVQERPRAGSAPRARCLSDPNEAALRPLIFLFCAESP